LNTSFTCELGGYASASIGDLRLNSERDSVRVLVWILQHVGRVDLGFELDGLDRRTLEAQRLEVIGGVTACGLDLHRPRERVRVVLERDDPEHARGVRIDDDDAAA
jgi:hypothetical protein